jgi:hypothetical protein
MQHLSSSGVKKGSNIKDAIRHLEQNYTHVGYEYIEWNKSMTTPAAVNLHNFEKIMLYATNGKTNYTLAKRFKAVAGNPC